MTGYLFISLGGVENKTFQKSKKNVLFHLVVRSGNYYLFETDSEEEEEEDKKEEEEPRKKSAFQVLYGNLLSC